MSVRAIPSGTPRVSPYLCVVGAKQAIAWYVEILGAMETMRIPGPKDTVLHAELRLGDSVVMLGEEAPERGALSPGKIGGTPVSLVVYVADVDEVFVRALAGGATEERPVADQPFGDRMGTLRDPFGHRWHLASRVEDITAAEIVRRMSPSE